MVVLQPVFPQDPTAQCAGGVSDTAQRSAGLLQPVEGRYPLAQSWGWKQPFPPVCLELNCLATSPSAG